jgi:hypothetical protein
VNVPYSWMALLAEASMATLSIYLHQNFWKQTVEFTVLPHNAMDMIYKARPLYFFFAKLSRPGNLLLCWSANPPGAHIACISPNCFKASLLHARFCAFCAFGLLLRGCLRWCVYASRPPVTSSSTF